MEFEKVGYENENSLQVLANSCCDCGCGTCNSTQNPKNSNDGNGSAIAKSLYWSLHN